MRRTGRLGTWMRLLALLGVTASAHSEPVGVELPGVDLLKKDPVTALRRVGPHFQAKDPVLQHRARRLGRLAAMEFLRRAIPDGMVLVTPTEWEFVGTAVRPTGGFYLGRTEVTRRAFGLHEPAKRADHPVTDVDLAGARAYAKRMGCRLPTLAELQQAATAAGVRRYPWGDRFDPARVHARESGASGPARVDALPGGAAPCGALGLLGNVAEWTETVIGKRNKRYLVAGGSYRTFIRKRRFATARLSPEAKSPDVGFRLARSLPKLPTAVPARAGS